MHINCVSRFILPIPCLSPSLSFSLSLPPPQALIKANNLEIRCPRQCFINNEFVDASDGKTYQTINPTDEAAICELAASGAQDVEKAIKAAKVRSRSYVYVYTACSKWVGDIFTRFHSTWNSKSRCKKCNYINSIKSTVWLYHICTMYNNFRMPLRRVRGRTWTPETEGSSSTGEGGAMTRYIRLRSLVPRPLHKLINVINLGCGCRALCLITQTTIILLSLILLQTSWPNGPAQGGTGYSGERGLWSSVHVGPQDTRGILHRHVPLLCRLVRQGTGLHYPHQQRQTEL